MKIGEGALFIKKGTEYMSILEPKFAAGDYFAPHENHCEIVLTNTSPIWIECSISWNSSKLVCTQLAKVIQCMLTCRPVAVAGVLWRPASMEENQKCYLQRQSNYSKANTHRLLATQAPQRRQREERPRLPDEDGR